MADSDPTRPLKDARQEAFARYMADGLGVYDAYCRAGYSPDRKNARKASEKPHIKARTDWLLKPALHAAGVDRERVMKEFAALAFSDIRKAMHWRSDITQEEDYADGGETLVVRSIVSHKGRFIESSKLDDETAAAIQSAEVTAEGAIKLKFHPKIPALTKLAELLRMLAPVEDPNKKNGDGGGGGPTLIQNVFNISPEQAQNEVMAAFRSARTYAQPAVIEQPVQHDDGGSAEDA